MNPENPEDLQAIEIVHHEIYEQENAVEAGAAEIEGVEAEIDHDLEANVNRVGDDIPVDQEVVIESVEEPDIEPCKLL